MRLGLDIGANSIGWWLYETKDGKITKTIDGGVRIFSDGRKPSGPDQVGEPLAVNRRLKRGTRRMRDRYLRRRAALKRKLIEAGMMPRDPVTAKKLEQLDPYELRARGLKEALPLEHFGRAIFHLSQRRGFKSNRKTDRGDNESGKIKDASKIKDATGRLDKALKDSGAQTLGEFLHLRRTVDKPKKHRNEHKINKDGTRLDDRRTKTVRTRLSVAKRGDAEKAESGYDFYPDRRHLEEEFNALWEAQITFHTGTANSGTSVVKGNDRPGHDKLTDELRKALFKIIFFQRPLKEPKIGLCLFAGYHNVPSDEQRLPKAHPLTQRRVLYETVNNLRVTVDGRKKRTLTLEDRDLIVEALDNKNPTKSLKSMQLKLEALGKKIGLASDKRFTLETIVRDAIACDPVHASLSHPTRFCYKWPEMDLEAQWEVVRRIRAVESDADHESLINWLYETHHLNDEQASAVADAPLPDGYGNIGETATKKILEVLKADVVTYDQAVKACGWHHSDLRTGEILEQLPYYGEVLSRHVIPGSGQIEDDEIERFGRITNPTVHVGLNQLRRVVNRIVTVYGKPDEIVVELARELKKSAEQRRKIQKIIKANTEAAKKRSKCLNELDQPDTGFNRILLRLYEELGPATTPRCCPYSGKTISVTNLFDGSCDIDHILPYSRTFDNSVANRTLCFREANRQKANKTPWEVWGGDTNQWEMISANLKNLPRNKRWRFSPDAMERFEGENDFLDRALVDTQYLSRIAREYLDTLFIKGGHVWVVPGRLTEMLRRHWGLNSLLPDHKNETVKAKNRTDHRHHAIDAAVIAATDRRLIKQISDMAKREERKGFGAEKVARSTPTPWGSFRADINKKLDGMIVSHRMDHGKIDISARQKGEDSTAGQLHNDTAYGIVSDSTVVSRKPLLSLNFAEIKGTSKGKKIRDSHLQQLLLEAVDGIEKNKDKKKENKEKEAALSKFATTETLSNGKPNPYLGIRRVRLVESLKNSARAEIKDKNGNPYKAYKCDSNHCYEIWLMPNGKPKSRVITTFEAHGNSVSCPHPAAKRLLRLFKRDMVVIERDGKKQICCVQKFDSGRVFLSPHNESNADARNRDSGDDFRLIQMGLGPALGAKLRRISVDEIGRLRESTPPISYSYFASNG